MICGIFHIHLMVPGWLAIETQHTFLKSPTVPNHFISELPLVPVPNK